MKSKKNKVEYEIFGLEMFFVLKDGEREQIILSREHQKIFLSVLFNHFKDGIETENTKTLNHTNKKSREGRRFLAAHVSNETIKQMGLLAVQQERTKQNILIEAINDLFVKYGLSRIAE